MCLQSYVSAQPKRSQLCMASSCLHIYMFIKHGEQNLTLVLSAKTSSYVAEKLHLSAYEKLGFCPSLLNKKVEVDELKS